ncbi:MAG TPA: hypothetical protein VGI86_16530, partial [Acidimicrobiia bacterium]
MRVRIARAAGLLPAFVAAVVVLFALLAGATTASAAPTQITAPTITAPTIPTPNASTTPTTDPNKASITIDVPNLDGTTNPAEAAKKAPGQSVLIILLLTVLAIAPALLMMVTSFTRIVIVLSLTRNALGLQTIPPNQVVVGLSLFLSLFIMAPTLSKVNDQGLQPLLKGDKNFSQAWDSAQKPLKDFMLKETRTDELNMFIKESHAKAPKNREDVSLAALVPAFVLSEI